MRANTIKLPPYRDLRDPDGPVILPPTAQQLADAQRAKANKGRVRRGVCVYGDVGCYADDCCQRRVKS